MNDWSWGTSETLTLLGILVSAFFSFLLWKVSRESTKAAKQSAAAAAASTRIAEELEAQRIQKAKLLKRVNLQPVQGRAQTIIYELLRMKEPESSSTYYFMSKQNKFEFSRDALAEHLTEDELNSIDYAWSLLYKLMHTHFDPLRAVGYEIRKNINANLEFTAAHDQTLEAFRVVTRL